VDPAKVKEIMA
jgi:hypothetical protein